MAKGMEVVVAGGAAVGSATALFLVSDPAFKGRVTVVEPDPSYAKSSTALSVASIRQQFSTPENIALSQFGWHFLSHIKDYCGPEAEISLRQQGYLLLAGEAGLEILKSNHATQRAMGAEIDLLDAQALAAEFPWLSTEGIVAGALGRAREGWFDPYGLLQAMRKAAIAKGAVYLPDRVTGISHAAGRVRGVSLASGADLSCDVLVNAAGPAAAELATTAGLVIPVERRKRFAYVIDCRDENRPGKAPLTVDATGVYFRPEGQHYICGVSPLPEDDGPCEADDFEVIYDLFEEVVWPALAERVPAFEAIKPINAWAGHYAYNTFDQNVLLGPHRDLPNFFFANGFSGHGIQQSPAVGRALSEWIVHGKSRSLDLDIFSVNRVAEGRAVKELNVI